MHWLRNSFGVIVAILLLIEVLMVFVVRNYYYTAAQEYVSSKMNIVSAAVQSNSEAGRANLNSRIRTYVESYDDKERIELMAINNDDEVEVTSSGFSPSKLDQMPDYQEAKNDAAGMSVQIYDLPTGEKVVAVSAVINAKDSQYSALRMLASMKKIDNQVLIIAATTFVVCLAIMLLIFFSGMYFVRSIVYPIRSIGDMTKQFAKGDFSERIKKESDDELGELCDSINYMADELSNTEQMKNEFISSVSHELRTPLTAIKGWTETFTSMY